MENLDIYLKNCIFENNLDVMILNCPKSEGLASLESMLYGSTSISTEGVLSRIKARFGKIKDLLNNTLDKFIISMNSLLGKIKLLNEEQKKRLKLVREGKLSLEKAKLPISKEVVVLVAKSLAAIGAFIGFEWLSRKTGQSLAKDIKERANPDPAKESNKLKSKLESMFVVLKQKQEEYDHAKENNASEQDLAGLSKVIEGLKKRAEKTKQSIPKDSFIDRNPAIKATTSVIFFIAALATLRVAVRYCVKLGFLVTGKIYNSIRKKIENRKREG